MKENNTIQIQELTSDEVKDQIYTIRSVQVMLDSDLAKIYGYETKNFNRQVKNNIDRFPEDMMFQLTSEEVRYISRCKNFTSIIQTSGIKGGRVYLPYVFTEQGIYMLMTVLKGELAIKQSLALVRIFKQMKDYLTDNSHLFKHLQDIDLRLSVHDKNFQKIFKKLESPKEKKAFVFSAGQLWDAASCLEDIFRKANKNITVIDKYVDKQTLDLLSKKSPGVSVTLVTDSMYCQLTEQEIDLFTKQYGKLEIKCYKKCHDRFIILDGKTLYHCGASLKDAGKQLFSIEQIEEPDVLKLIKEILIENK